MAVSDIEKHRRRWEENPKGLTFAPYADALRKAGEAEQALDVLKAGLEHHPDYIPANIVLGRCHLDLGDDPSAEGAFGQVLALDPENVIALKALADVSERGQRWGSATRWLDLLLAIDRGNDAAREQMVRVQVAELEAAQQAGAPIYPDAQEPDWAGTPSEAPAGPTAEINLQLDAVDVFAGSDVEATPLEGWVNREIVDTRNITVPEDFGVDLRSGMAAAVSTSAERHEMLMPSVDFVFEGHDESDVEIALEGASGEFAVADAAEAPRDGNAGSDPVAEDATPWSDVGAGEYVPAIFADDVEAVPPSGSPSVTDGLVLDQTDEAMVFAAVPDEARVLEVPAAEDMTFESVSIEATEMVDAVPAEAGMPTRITVPSPVGLLSLDASEVLSLDQRAREAVLTAFVARRNVEPVNVLARAPVADPAVVAALAAADVVVADHTAAPDALESSVVWEEWTWGEGDPDLALLETLVEAPISAVAHPQLVVAEPAVEVPVAASVDPAETEAPIAVVDAVPAPPVVPSGDPSPFVPAEANVATDDEQDAVPPNFTAPVLITAAMAALYEGQGHLGEALSTYRDLERR